VRTSFVGVNDNATNFVSSSLMDLAGNPYGTYGQEELCVACGGRLVEAPRRRLHHKVLTKVAFWALKVTKPFKAKHPIWIHMLLRKHAAVTDRPQVDAHFRPSRTAFQRDRERFREGARK
jgi:hypothetical protein